MKPELAPPLWKEQTCESCVYRSDVHCRRIPPVMGSGIVARYPLVLFDDSFNDACAEWKRDPTEEMQ